LDNAWLRFRARLSRIGGHGVLRTDHGRGEGALFFCANEALTIIGQSKAEAILEVTTELLAQE